MQELYIGLMSGTSVDAVDAVLLQFDDDNPRLRSHLSLPWPDELRSRILTLAAGCKQELEEAGQLDQLIGRHHAIAVQELLTKADCKADAVTAIGLHGQTVRHRPRLVHPFTWQLGDPNIVAEATGIMVACDFRRRDMAAGGQGAPLVPAFHEALFRQPSQVAVAINLGGIANITVISPDRDTIGYDTGPANMLLDAWCQRHQQLAYDHDGAWARSGSVLPALLEQLLQHPYFKLAAPKSTGREEFGERWLEDQLRRWAKDHDQPEPADVQATLAELTAVSLAQAIRQHASTGLIVLCGGGAYNSDLRDRLRRQLPAWQLSDSHDFGIAPQWVEACAFAWLARQLVGGRPGNLPAVTGARGHRWLGGLYPGAAGFKQVCRR